MNTLPTFVSQALDSQTLGFSIVLFVWVLIMTFIIIMCVTWIIALVHLVQHDDVKDRTLWLVLLLVVGGLVGPVYYFAVKKPYDKAHKTKSA